MTSGNSSSREGEKEQVLNIWCVGRGAKVKEGTLMQKEQGEKKQLRSEMQQQEMTFSDLHFLRLALVPVEKKLKWDKGRNRRLLRKQ